MTKKEKLQDQAKGLDGYSDSMTIAQLETLIAQTSPKEKESGADGSGEPEKSEETDRTKMREYANKTRTNDDVCAACIKTVKRLENKAVLQFDNADSVEVSNEFVRQYDPRPSGYYVEPKSGGAKYMRKYEFEEFYFPKN